MSTPNDPTPIKTIPGPPRPNAGNAERPEVMRTIQTQLARVARGDLRAPIEAGTDDPSWSALTAQINRAIDSARRAIERAEGGRREAALSRDKALAAARSETHFLTNVSHEIHTPLASIRSAAEILRMYPEEPAQTRAEFLDMILAGTQRLDDLVGQVLDLGRISAGGVRWDFQPTDLASTIRAALDCFAPVASRCGVHLETDFEPGLPQVPVDPARIQQVWASLVDNAVKFSGANDRIRVRTAGTAEGVEVLVQDWGIGVAPEHHQAIFQRFFQVTDGLTDKPAGAGLGLSIAQEIVHNHQGTIEVMSEVGEGAIFRVHLRSEDR